MATHVTKTNRNRKLKVTSSGSRHIRLHVDKKHFFVKLSTIMCNKNTFVMERTESTVGYWSMLVALHVRPLVVDWGTLSQCDSCRIMVGLDLLIVSYSHTQWRTLNQPWDSLLPVANHLLHGPFYTTVITLPLPPPPAKIPTTCRLG